MRSLFGDGWWELVEASPRLVLAGVFREEALVIAEPGPMLSRRGWAMVKSLLRVGVLIRRGWDWLTDWKEWWAAATFAPDLKIRCFFWGRRTHQNACFFVGAALTIRLSSPTAVVGMEHAMVLAWMSLPWCGGTAEARA